MRIGKMHDSDRSENLIRLIQSESSENLTGKEKWKNWWHYNKWYVVCGVILLGIACNLIGSALGLWEKSPDFQIAYVGKTQLSEDAASALVDAFTQLGPELDFNGDGEIYIRLNQYTDGSLSTDLDLAYSQYASEITLIGDISDCESYFFLMDDPEKFQQEYQLLALPDGSCPDNTDHSTKNKVILWADCPALTEIAAAVEAESPGSMEMFTGLYVGRRCFYADKTSENVEKCSELWNRMTRAVQE